MTETSNLFTELARQAKEVDRALWTTWSEPPTVERARTCLQETAVRGHTAAERSAAIAWLEAAPGRQSSTPSAGDTGGR